MPEVGSTGSPQARPAGEMTEMLRAKRKQPVDGKGKPLAIRKSGYDALDKNSFLKLLVTQLSKQDPTNPMNDREFISQMAQFTSLQQTQSLTTEMAKLSRSQEIVAANSYIGQQVTVKDGTNGSTKGIVSGVQMNADGPQIVVGDQTYPISAVLSVSPGLFSTFTLPPATAGAA